MYVRLYVYFMYIYINYSILFCDQKHSDSDQARDVQQHGRGARSRHIRAHIKHARARVCAQQRPMYNVAKLPRVHTRELRSWTTFR